MSAHESQSRVLTILGQDQRRFRHRERRIDSVIGEELANRFKVFRRKPDRPVGAFSPSRATIQLKRNKLRRKIELAQRPETRWSRRPRVEPAPRSAAHAARRDRGSVGMPRPEPARWRQCRVCRDRAAHSAACGESSRARARRSSSGASSRKPNGLMLMMLCAIPDGVTVSRACSRISPRSIRSSTSISASVSTASCRQSSMV